MKIALFGGSFDPVHCEHVRLAEAAIAALSLDKVAVMPSYLAPHKRAGAAAGGDVRAEACRIAFRNVRKAEVSEYELSRPQTSYTYLTCRAFAERYPDAERYFLMGADMLEDFFSWRYPEDILKNVTLVVCGRKGYRADCERRFRDTFGCGFIRLDFEGGAVSSTEIRTRLAFGERPAALDGAVCDLLLREGCYSHPAILPALALEKEERRAHSLRVALMATARARSAGVNERQALLAAALHDCGKYVPLSSPLLRGFVPPENVPAPVLHQYTGAYLAEHAFGVTDGEVLDAIRYHTSGKAGMTALGMLVFLADLLEPGRSFAGVEGLRELFYTDLRACLSESLRQQTEYLKRSKKPVYPLTEEAFRWITGEL